MQSWPAAFVCRPGSTSMQSDKERESILQVDLVIIIIIICPWEMCRQVQLHTRAHEQLSETDK